MRMTARIRRLESLYAAIPVPGLCPSCGQITRETPQGLFRPGVLVPRDDGTEITWCFCKRCGKSFHATLTALEAGCYRAENVIFGNDPI